MRFAQSWIVVVGAGGLAVVMALGCAAPNVPFPAEDVSQLRQKRREEVRERLEERRKQAEFSAAPACWQQGDVAGCRGAHCVELAQHTEAADPDDGNDLTLPSRRAFRQLLDEGDRAMSHGSIELAMACFREAMSLNPDDPQTPTIAAVSALRHNQPDAAIAILEPSVDIFPDSPAIRRVLGTAYYRRGDYKSAQLAFQQALSLDKSSALSYFLMGCTLAKLGRADAADVSFRQAQRIDPRYSLKR